MANIGDQDGRIVHRGEMTVPHGGSGLITGGGYRIRMIFGGTFTSSSGDAGGDMAVSFTWDTPPSGEHRGIASISGANPHANKPGLRFVIKDDGQGGNHITYAVLDLGAFESC